MLVVTRSLLKVSYRRLEASLALKYLIEDFIQQCHKEYRKHNIVKCSETNYTENQNNHCRADKTLNKRIYIQPWKKRPSVSICECLYYILVFIELQSLRFFVLYLIKGGLTLNFTRWFPSLLFDVILLFNIKIPQNLSTLYCSLKFEDVN